MRRPLIRRVAPLLLEFALGACQGQPAVLLQDPNQILAATATSAAAATSVHIDLSADGRVALDPFGTGAGTPIDLEGTTAAADIDLSTGKTRATFAAPGLLGLAGEAIVVEDGAYLKSTLTGPKFRLTPLARPAEAPLKGITDLLARTDLAPVKGADVPCAGGTCYTVTIELTPDELAGLVTGVEIPTGLPIPLPDVSAATVDLTLLVEQVSTRLAGVTAALDLGDTGDLTIEATFTRWNEPVSIAAPPADQVEGAG